MKNRLKNMSSYSKKSAAAYSIVIIAFIIVSVLDSFGFITNSLYGQLPVHCVLQPHSPVRSVLQV